MVYTLDMSGIYITYTWYIKIFKSVYQNILARISKYFRQYIQISIISIYMYMFGIYMCMSCICMV